MTDTMKSDMTGAMGYSEKLLDHFNHPRNMGSLPADDPEVGTGVVGSPECGDVMKLQIRVADGGLIADAKFKTFGCGAAIASSSLATEWLKGRSLADARRLKNTDLADELKLPPVKMHCSVLAEGAVKAAIEDYAKKRGQTPTEAAEGVTACASCPTRETCGPIKAIESNGGDRPADAAPDRPPAPAPAAADARLVALRDEADRLLTGTRRALDDAGGALDAHQRKMIDMALAMLETSRRRDDPDQVLLAIDMVREAAAPLTGKGDRLLFAGPGDPPGPSGRRDRKK